MKVYRLLTLICVISLNTILAQENTVNSAHALEKSNLELPNIQVTPIKDTKNNRQYELYIKLPEGYSENKDKKYPVLYFTDAMWHVEILSGSTEYMVKDVILVGISWQKDINEDLMKKSGAHVSRYRDYSISKSNNLERQAKYQYGQASNHLDFISTDVITYVENNYRTNPDNRSYFGYSLGGLFGAYILLKQPDIFKNYILGSPSLWRDIPYLSKLESNTRLKNKELNTNVFISYGDLEKELGTHIEEFITLLKNRNDESLMLENVVIEGGHESAFPMTGIRSMSWVARMNSFPFLKDPYFGQKRPGLTPEVFAPGIVSTNDFEIEAAFAPNMKEFYFVRQKKDESPKSHVLQYKNGEWHESVSERNSGEVFITTNGRRMLLGNKYRTRTSSGWSEEKSLGPLLKDIPIMRLTASAAHTYVFDERKEQGVIRYSRYVNREHEEPKEFNKEINTGKFTAHPFIAPDESYIIWDSEREDGFGDSDLYVSFREEDGSWGPAINMGKDINNEHENTYGSVSPDGKYFFFNTIDLSEGNRVANIFWVDAQVIENLRPVDNIVNQNNRFAPEYGEFNPKHIDYYFEKAIPNLKKAFITSTPENREDGILAGELGVDGGNKDIIVKLANEIANKKHGSYHSMLVSYKDKLIFESYYLRGRINLPHSQASASKAYVSLAIGRAIQLGYLTMDDLNKPIIHILKNLDIENLADGAENITLHNLMSMRSGISVSADKLESIITDGFSTTQEFLQHSSAISAETQTYKYQGINPRITWQILDSLVPGSAEDFVKNEILAKIGITVYDWKNDAEDTSITSRDMIKLGALVKNEGKWNDEQLISAEFLAKATSKITKPTEDWQPDSYNYGYFWYQTDMTVGDKSYNAKFAWGGGGQYVITVEELDLIIAITGFDFEDTIMTQVSKQILPAFVN